MRDEDDKLTFFYNGDKDLEVFNIMETHLDEQEHDLVEFYDEFLIDIYLLIDYPETKHIAIDWDNTISADMTFFIQLIKKLKIAGYSPFVCTLRAPDRENIKEIRTVLEKANIAIYLTDGKPKRKYMKKLGVKVHLWIDDFYPGICRETNEMLLRNKII